MTTLAPPSPSVTPPAFRAPIQSGYAQPSRHIWPGTRACPAATPTRTRASTSPSCADHHLDPLAARRLDAELYVRWLQEATGEARGRTRCRGAAGPSGPRVDVLLRPFVSWACRLPDTRQIAADAIFNFGLPTVHVSVQFGEAGARLIVPPHLTNPGARRSSGLCPMALSNR